MLLKWIFTILAVLYLYRVLMQLYRPPAPPPPPPPPPPAEPLGSLKVQRRDERLQDGDYIDYEELT